jgi:hypothetical protein
VGLVDGSCQGYTAFVDDGGSGVAGVRTRLAGAGWTPTDGVDGTQTTYLKDGRTLVLTVTQDKTTDVTLRFP